jgi:IS5 family transposase
MFTGLKIQFEITDPYLDNMIAQDHELVKLKKILDWKALNRIYKECYPSRKGRSTKNTDLVIGLLLLKHFYNLSWERLICGLHENIAMMYFCSVSFMAVVESKKRSKNLVTKSTMIKIMKRLGADRVKRLETNFREQLRKAGAIVSVNPIQG